MFRLASALLLIVAFAATLLPPAASPAYAATERALWDALRSGGHIAIMRHARAPGTGDPSNFQVDDCSTQRNLNDTGREQSADIGRAFREKGVEFSRVLSSQWCRCLDTAREMNLGPEVEEFPALNSFFQRRQNAAGQTAELKAFVSEPFDGKSIMLVTHQVNISGLASVFTSEGEIVVLEPKGDGQFEVLGSLEPARAY